MTGMTTIISIYASMILDGLWEWDNVPPVLLPYVEDVYGILTGEKPNHKQ